MAEQASIQVPAQLQECQAVNWMPFGIAYDGPAITAAQYFQPQQEAEGGDKSPHLVASFRGRHLRGTCKPLPEGFQGLVLKPVGSSSNASISDAQQRSWQAVGSFKQVVLWAHDAVPAATDPSMRCIDWLALAHQIHQPVTAAAVDEEMQGMAATGVQ